MSRETIFDLTISTNDYISYAYKVALLPAECANLIGYTIVPDLSPAAISLAGIPDGTVMICAAGLNENTIDIANAVSANWVKDTTPPALLFTLTPPIALGNSAAYSLSGTCSENGRVVSVTVGNATTSTLCSSLAFQVTGLGVSLIGTDGPVAITASQTDAAGNTGQATTTTLQDTVAPTLTINQAATQIDPVTALPIEFELEFSEATNPSTLTAADFTQAGTASGITWSLSTSDNLNWLLTATAIATGGTVQPSLAAGAVTDFAGNLNQSSTSSDNSVTYITPPPAPTVLALGPDLEPIDIDTTPTITVSGITSGNTVRLFTDSSCATEIASGVASGTSVGLTPGSALPDGGYSFFANQENVAGPGACSIASVSYLLDSAVSELSLSPFLQKTTEGSVDSTFSVWS